MYEQKKSINCNVHFQSNVFVILNFAPWGLKFPFRRCGVKVAKHTCSGIMP